MTCAAVRRRRRLPNQPDLEDPAAGEVRDRAEVQAAVRAYLPTRDSRGADSEPALFLNTRSGRLGRRALDHLVTRWFIRAGVPQPPGEAAHAFRHTYAVGLVSNGAALPAVQELLGHENLATTSVYGYIMPRSPDHRA